MNASSGQHKTNTQISFFHFYDNTQPPSFALLFSSLSVITIQLHINTLLPLASVTRFGEISPLCQKFKGLWQSFMDLFSIWQVFIHFGKFLILQVTQSFSALNWQILEKFHHLVTLPLSPIHLP